MIEEHNSDKDDEEHYQIDVEDFLIVDFNGIDALENNSFFEHLVINEIWSYDFSFHNK